MIKFLKTIDDFLNGITMYRLVLYYLLALLAVAMIFGASGILPYDPISLVVSAVLITAICWITNKIFATVFEAKTNVESVYITALILTLIITPLKLSAMDWVYFPIFIWAPIWAMASKYILAIRKKHIFNPAAFGVAITIFTIGQSATWWVGGNLPMLAFVFLLGLLTVRKIQRADLTLSFFAAAAISLIFTSYSGDPFTTLWKAILHSPIFFFAFVMLTEPLTTPSTRPLRILYGALVGFLFAPGIHVGSIYSSPELALVAGNVFSYLVSPKWKQLLALKQKTKVGLNAYDFSFASERKLNFKPGQYLEWTLEHPHPDSRGNRRYFTIASSPTENEIKIGVKFYEKPSSFKRSLFNLKIGGVVAAGQLAGDFTLPRSHSKKLAFVAGGIGITPFRSMIKYLMDRSESRDIVLFYVCRNAAEFAYHDIFEKARERIGLKVEYVLTGDQIPNKWGGRTEKLTSSTIRQVIPDYRQRTFYISGPRSMILSFEKALRDMEIKKGNVKTDFFPGFA